MLTRKVTSRISETSNKGMVDYSVRHALHECALAMRIKVMKRRKKN